MSLYEKVKSSLHVCGIELDFAGSLTPSSSEEFLNFYNSYENNNIFIDTYFGQKRVRFNETTTDTDPGTVYNQTLTIQFPSNDLNRALRLELFKKVKYIKIKLNNNSEMVMGRNDYYQNKKPSVKISSDLKISKVTFSTRSIAPLSYIQFDNSNFIIENLFFPLEMPIDFINVVNE